MCTTYFHDNWEQSILKTWYLGVLHYQLTLLLGALCPKRHGLKNIVALYHCDQASKSLTKMSQWHVVVLYMYFSIQWVQWRLLTVEEKSCSFAFESVNHHLIELMQVSELKATNIVLPNCQCSWVCAVLDYHLLFCFPTTYHLWITVLCHQGSVDDSVELIEGSALSLICWAPRT